MGDVIPIPNPMALGVDEASLPGGEGWWTGALLPIQKNRQTGQWAWAVPRTLSDMLSGAMAPGKAARGEYSLMVDPNTGENYYDGMAGDAYNLTQMLTLGSGAYPKEPNTLGIFGGKMAATADKAALAQAEQMAAKGASRDEIWNATGWFKGADGKWRFEIPDNTAKYLPDGMKEKNYSIAGEDVLSREGTVGTVMQHPGMLKAYPDIENMAVGQTGYGKGNRGIYLEQGISPEMIGLDKSVVEGSNQRPIMLHELQHAIQNREGFATGGNAESMAMDIPNPALAIYENAAANDTAFIELQKLGGSADYQSELARSNKLFREEYEPRIDALEAQVVEMGDYEKLKPQMDAVFDEFKRLSRSEFPTMARMDDLQSQLNVRGIPLRRPSLTLSRDEAYRRLVGETEARNVEFRMNMTPEQRRAKAPWLTQDVADGLQIVRMRGN